jgi:peptide/nickel transport system substrate-binding protein
MDEEFLDSAEQTSEDPQTIVYKIKQDAAWSDGTPVSADDFIYLWKNSNGSNKDIDVASTAGYDRIQSVEGSDNGKTVTVVYKEPFAEWKGIFTGILPAHYVESASGTPAWTRTRRRSPRPARSRSRTTPPARA